MLSYLEWRVALVSIVTLAPFAAHAATLTVNSSADAGGTCPGATCTLRQAIATASSGDTINFAPGIATIHSEGLSINKNLTINGPGPNLLTVSGKFDSVFYVEAGNFNVAISGLTISNGTLGIYNGGTLTITNCTISNNTYYTNTGTSRGGIYNSGGTLTITKSTVTGNTAYSIHSAGGGIFNSVGGTVTITDSNISGNTSTSPNPDSSFSSSEGGGIANGGTLQIARSTISGNNAHDAGGGISSRSNDATATITSSTIAGNSSFDEGGGIAIGSNSTATITSSTIAGNSGGWGGLSIENGMATISSSTIAGNSIAGNSTTLGAGGITNHGSVVARNTIIARNRVNSGGPNTHPDFQGPLISQGFNLIGIGNGAGVTPAQPTDQIGTAAAPIDPLLGVLQDNGGPTYTMALFVGSPARDRGDSGGSTTDQRGFTRPVDNPDFANATGGDGSDIGAFEIQAGVAAKSLNISTRARVQTGDNTLIGGFIITGNAPKPVVLRALGPSLVNSGLPAPAVLSDPVLELRGASGAVIASNDDWKQSPQRSQIEGSVFQPSDDREAVILTTLPPASYTAVVRGKGSDQGLALVEVYDLDQSTDSALANLSSRAFVETGNNVAIAGFTLGGRSGSSEIIIRGMGPSLGSVGVANPMANPTLELRDANGALLVAVDDWASDSSQANQLIAVGLQPHVDREAAIATLLPPGIYTAILAGKSGGTGVAVVEIYNLQ